MSANWQAVAWSPAQLGDGLHALAQFSGLYTGNGTDNASPAALAADQLADIDRWLSWASNRLNLEAESVDTPLSQVDTLLRQAGPAVLQITQDSQPQFLLLLKHRFGSVHLLAPDLSSHRYPVAELRAALCAPYEAPLSAELDRLLTLAEVPNRQLGKVKALLLQERLAGTAIGGCWLLRLPPACPFWQQLTQARLPQRVLLLLAVFTLAYGLEIINWRLIGQAAINGELDLGWFYAWVLLALSLIPLHLLGSWLDASFALAMARILKKRLLAGALRLDLEFAKSQGAGQLLGRVMESQALEALALNGGFSVLVAAIELVFAGWILAHGAGGYAHLLLLLAWLTVTLALCARYFQRLRHWTRARLDMTQALVERMVGHRTCLAQESAQRRIQQEDQTLQQYLQHSLAIDQAAAPIVGGLARAWLLVGLLGMAPAFIAGTASTSSLAISLGGLLLANRALLGIASGLTALARAAIAWTSVSMLFHAATTADTPQTFLATTPKPARSPAATKLIDASDLVFRYPGQSEPVLRGLNLTLYKGERILLEGASGGGKSTLAGLLVGLRQPDSGLLLLNGLDRHTLGDSWHQLATEAPQFHENHILTGTLAFNLLMGRNWPASEDDLNKAQTLCVDLGLGPLLERMPAGLMQRVGETGWQLSHGERSRIFLARALLQNAPLTILDESFAALDPESLEKCLACVFKQVQTLVVIAHP